MNATGLTPGRIDAMRSRVETCDACDPGHLEDQEIGEAMSDRRDLLAEVDRLTAETIRYHDAHESLTAERDRLRAALEKISMLPFQQPRDIAREALGR